ncbi:MAG: PEGA domain-containing protein [Patescibacteria group bacterium]
MTKKYRYLLLLLGFVVFLILAPTIVLYVRGITYDFSKKAFVTTGILAMRLEPKDANIYLNNKLKRESSGDIKFILPGEYDVTVKKDGYFTWSKRLSVESGQVAWGSPAYNKIYLLLKNPLAQKLADNVIDAYGESDNLVYLSKSNLNIIPMANPTTAKTFPLPFELNKIVTADADLNNIILSASGTKLTLFNKPTEKFLDLSAMFENGAEFGFNGNDIYALSSGTLFSVDPNKKIKNQLFSDVKAFYFQDNLLYFVQNTSSQKPALYTSKAPFSSSQVLLNNLPDFSVGKLFITYEKQIFLLADKTLYLANSTMEKMVEDISFSNFQKTDSALALIHLGQADFFDPLAHNFNYVTRTTENLNSLIVRNSIGQAFYISSGKINSIELDTRDKQNQHLLYNGTAEKFFVDRAAKNIILLDGGILKSMIIR